MILDELRTLVAEGESERLEIKRTTAELNRALRTACGLLNCGITGHVLFGVTSAGRVAGQPVGAMTVEEIVQRLQNAFEPPPSIGIDCVPAGDDRSVIVLRVTTGGGLSASDGHPSERIGRTTRRMAKATDEQRVLEEAHSGNRWESQAAEGFAVDDVERSGRCTRWDWQSMAVAMSDNPFRATRSLQARAPWCHVYTCV